MFQISAIEAKLVLIVKCPRVSALSSTAPPPINPKKHKDYLRTVKQFGKAEKFL
jgi:hypothetical protein